VPSKLADRTDDARSDETFGLTETKTRNLSYLFSVFSSFPALKPGNLAGLKSDMADHPDARPLCASICEVPYGGKDSCDSMEKSFRKMLFKYNLRLMV
jgi:hypothetical protein